MPGRLPLLKNFIEEIQATFDEVAVLKNRLHKEKLLSRKYWNKIQDQQKEINLLENSLSLYQKSTKAQETPEFLEQHCNDVVDGKALMSGVLYKETPTRPASFDYKHKKQC